MPAPDVNAALAIAAGLLLLVVPGRLRRQIEEKPRTRLAELELGAEENYFEEKRSLRAYPPSAVGILRAGGFVLLGLSLSRLWGQFAG